MNKLKMLSFLLVAVSSIVVIYLIYLNDAMKSDFPLSGESILLDYYDSQVDYRTQNGFFDINLDTESVSTNSYNDNARLFLNDTNISNKYCKDCMIEKNNFKIICIEFFSVRDFYTIYTIDNHKNLKRVKNIPCENCNWSKILDDQ